MVLPADLQYLEQMEEQNKTLRRFTRMAYTDMVTDRFEPQISDIREEALDGLKSSYSVHVALAQPQI